VRFSLTRLFGIGGPRMITCRQVGKLLQRYLDGDLDEARMVRLAAHLEDCRRCGLEAATYERIKTALADRHVPVPTESLARLRAFGEQLARGEVPHGHEHDDD